MHVMQVVSENRTCLGRNCAFQVSTNLDIVLNRDVCQRCVTDPSDIPDSTEQMFQNTTQIMI